MVHEPFRAVKPITARPKKESSSMDKNHDGKRSGSIWDVNVKDKANLLTDHSFQLKLFKLKDNILAKSLKIVVLAQ